MAVAIDEWTQDQHLTAETIDRYADQFASHPARLLVIPDFLKQDKADRLARYLAEDLEYERKFGLYSDEAPVAEDRWNGAESSNRFFRFSQPVGVRPESQLSPNTLIYMKFKAAFADPAFRQFFERVTRMPLAYSSDDIGAHAMVRGDFMGAHDDDNRERQLAIIIYLSPDWQPEYGGALRVVDGNGESVEIWPAFNSLAMFDVRAETTHQVLAVTDAAGERARRTIGGWYHRTAS